MVDSNLGHRKARATRCNKLLRAGPILRLLSEAEGPRPGPPAVTGCRRPARDSEPAAHARKLERLRMLSACFLLMGHALPGHGDAGRMARGIPIFDFPSPIFRRLLKKRSANLRNHGCWCHDWLCLFRFIASLIVNEKVKGILRSFFDSLFSYRTTWLRHLCRIVILRNNTDSRTPRSHCMIQGKAFFYSETARIKRIVSMRE
jgi:hypothetical protein